MVTTPKENIGIGEKMGAKTKITTFDSTWNVGLGTPELNARGEYVRPRQRRYSEKRESPGFSYGECQLVTAGKDRHMAP